MGLLRREQTSHFVVKTFLTVRIIVRCVANTIISGIYYKHCYAPSILVIVIVKYTSTCSILYDRNYGAGKARASLLEAYFTFTVEASIMVVSYDRHLRS
jgi:hypothetical protein